MTEGDETRLIRCRPVYSLFIMRTINMATQDPIMYHLSPKHSRPAKMSIHLFNDNSIQTNKQLKAFLYLFFLQFHISHASDIDFLWLMYENTTCENYFMKTNLPPKTTPDKSGDTACTMFLQSGLQCSLNLTRRVNCWPCIIYLHT